MEVKTIDLKKSILENNDLDADKLREELKEKKTYYMNIMSSPGSGKTTTLISTIKHLAEMAGGADGPTDPEAAEKAGASADAGIGTADPSGSEAAEKGSSSPSRPLKIGVMEADIDSDVDARTIIEKTGVPSVQLHTGGMCHLDAQMSRQGLAEIDADALDLVFLENVGNLVCPAEFDTGAQKSAVILSIPEGDDKPLKYPLMFKEVDVVLVNKIDAMQAFDFDEQRFRDNLKGCNPDAPVFFISAATGEGMDEWCSWLDQEVRGYLE